MGEPLYKELPFTTTRYQMSARKDRGPISFITSTLRAFLYTVLQNGGVHASYNIEPHSS